MSESMVLRVAKAILTAEGVPLDAEEMDWARGIVRTCLEEMREPTPAMHDAAVLTFMHENGGVEYAPVAGWRAMIDAALKEEPKP